MNDFNPRSREGNDMLVAHMPGGLYISIHVPARGTTASGSYTILLLTKFQSTFPRGERQFIKAYNLDNQDISIHVPARGTTPVSYAFSSAPLFQSTFPRGERLQFCLISIYILSQTLYICIYSLSYPTPPLLFQTHFCTTFQVRIS